MTGNLSALDIMLRIGLIIIASGVIGFEREHHNRPAGLRTHILVGLGAALVALTEAYNLQNISSLATQAAQVSVGRMTAQVISGIGFLGAGTILVHRHSITGLTTAASLWNVACLGIAAGYGYISICLIGAGATLIVLAVIRRMLPFYMQRRVEISYANREKTLKFINSIFANQNIRVLNADYSIAREERSARFECLSEQDNPHNQTDCLGQDIRGSNPIEAARCSNTYTLGFPAGYDFIVFFRLLFEDPDVLAVRVIDG